MIRVNLLPRRRESKREGGRAWVYALVAMFLLEIVAIIVVHANKKKELDAQVAKNSDVEKDITEKRGKVANHDAVKRQLADYQAREDAIAKLQAGRTGPTAMMLELSRIMTPGKMPTVDANEYDKLRHENPAALPSEKWDPHRLWLISFKEENRVVAINGIGKTNDDVAELMRRLNVSVYFDEVKLVKTEEKKDKELTGDQPAINFDMRAKVRY